MNIEQGTAEWFALRRGRFTSSRFGDLMSNGRGKDTIGKTAQTYIMEIAYEMATGETVGFTGNAATEWGVEWEDTAREYYAGVTGQQVESVGFCAHPSNPYAGGSPDGLVGMEGILEIKCPYNGVKHLQNIVDNAFLSDYDWQCHGNMWVTGRNYCDLVSYDPRCKTKPIHIVRIDRDEDKIAQLEQRVNECANLLNSYLDALNYQSDFIF